MFEVQSPNLNDYIEKSVTVSILNTQVKILIMVSQYRTAKIIDIYGDKRESK